jgi:hypothetical protein
LFKLQKIKGYFTIAIENIAIEKEILDQYKKILKQFS